MAGAVNEILAIRGIGMIKLITRQAVFQAQSVLAHYVHAFQTAAFDPVSQAFQAGEAVFLSSDDDEPTVLSEAEALKLNAEQQLYFDGLTDRFDTLPKAFIFAGQVIAELDEKSFERFCEIVGDRLERLCRAMGWQCLYLLGSTRQAILAQRNDTELVQKARADLFGLGLTEDYCDGFQFDCTDLSVLMASLFPIVRFNAEAPSICFSGAEAMVVGVLCQYGNIHFECYDEAEFDQLKTGLVETGFICINDGICEERFSPDGVIDGRRITV